jgi:hypothetical protein
MSNDKEGKLKTNTYLKTHNIALFIFYFTWMKKMKVLTTLREIMKSVWRPFEPGAVGDRRAGPV